MSVEITSIIIQIAPGRVKELAPSRVKELAPSRVKELAPSLADGRRSGVDPVYYGDKHHDIMMMCLTDTVCRNHKIDIMMMCLSKSQAS